MSEKDKQNLMEDSQDEGLKAVMGSRFQDRTQEPRKAAPKAAQVMRERPPVKMAKQGAAPQAAAVEDPGWIGRLKACVKYGSLFASVSALLFYWQQAGLLASSAAVPSLIFCALGAGLTIGWNAR